MDVLLDMKAKKNEKDGLWQSRIIKLDPAFYQMD